MVATFEFSDFLVYAFVILVFLWLCVDIYDTILDIKIKLRLLKGG